MPGIICVYLPLVITFIKNMLHVRIKTEIKGGLFDQIVSLHQSSDIRLFKKFFFVAVLPPPKHRIPLKIVDIPPRPTRKQCSLCSNWGHWPHLCPHYENMWDRKQYFRENGICQDCGKKHADQDCSDEIFHICKWFHCRLAEQHLSVLCPCAPVTITRRVRAEWKKQLLLLKEEFHL